MERNVILVGRHAPEGLPSEINVIEQKNILWSLEPQEIENQWKELVKQAREEKCAILLQNVPGVLARVITHEAADAAQYFAKYPVSVGVIISQPGERKAGVRERFVFNEASDADEFVRGIKHTNSRVKIDDEDGKSNTIFVTVDPVTPFEFVRIEWML